MRVGIIGLLHESNTFAAQPTTLRQFEEATLLAGDAIREHFSDAHHEIGGFLTGLESAGDADGHQIEAVPVFVARALPSGTITSETWSALLSRMFTELSTSGRLDGILVAPHGATVSEDYPDADGHWLSELRRVVGPGIPIIGTIDAHANLSPRMVASCDALTAYRSNPHLDQRERGLEAAQLMVRTLAGEITPTMHAEFPPLAVNIERQYTSDPHWIPLYELADAQLGNPHMLTNSIVLGFPYADVAELGSAVIAVADGDALLARSSARELADQLWQSRHEMIGQFLSVDEAVEQARQLPGSVCLLDMGDNVGGGSAADGTWLANALHDRRISGSFVCLYDPESVRQAEQAGAGAKVSMQLGGKTDDLHGPPLCGTFTVRSLHEGKFQENQPRHGGMSSFDQGRTALVESDHGLTVMLTSKRMVPFSLQQLYYCGLDPSSFRILVAKGVNAPVAAYQEVCQEFLRVNTPGSTCADMTQLPFQNRRRPMFPFELETPWSVD